MTNSSETLAMEEDAKYFSQFPEIEVLEKEISPKEFYQRFVKAPGKPVIIRNFAKNWPALSRWTPEFFGQQYGAEIVNVTGDQGSRSMKVRDYIPLMTNRNEKSPYYLKDWSIPKTLYSDFSTPGFARSWHHSVPLVGRRMLSWLYIGGKNTFSRIHIDVLGSHAYNVVLSGRKFWVFLPPGENEKSFLSKDPFNADIEIRALLSKQNCAICLQEPGDLVFTPGDWLHAVHNIEPGVAITENFFDVRDRIRTLKGFFPMLIASVVQILRLWRR